MFRSGLRCGFRLGDIRSRLPDFVAGAFRNIGLVLFCAAIPACAQYRYDVWTADNGLPQNIVRSIYQAPDGFLWVATFDGVVRFDGVHFTVYNKGNTPGIESNRFGSMYGDEHGDLWLGTEDGALTHYHNGVFQLFGPAQGVVPHTLLGINGDGAGHVWVLFSDTIAEWNEAKGQFVDITPKDLRIHYEPFRWPNAGFWGVDKNGLHCFLRGQFVTYPLPPWLTSESIWNLGKDENGTIWLETMDGKHVRIDPNGTVSRINGPGDVATYSYVDHQGHSWTISFRHRLQRFLEVPGSGHITEMGFNTLYEDREHNLWLGSEGQGLYLMQRQFIQTYSRDQGLTSYNIYPIYQDHAGAIWIGAWGNGPGLFRFDDGKFAPYNISNNFRTQLLTSICEDREGRLWVATHGGLFLYQHGRFEQQNSLPLPERSIVQAVYQDREGTIWFGTSLGLLADKDGTTRLFTKADGLAVDDVRVIKQSRSGDLWIGGYGGLTRLRNEQFTHWTEHDGLPSNNIRAIYEDGDGVIWIGTYDGGLGRFKDGRFTTYNVGNGLFNNGVFQILEDGRGNLWMSCNRGIYRVSKQELNDYAAGTRRTITSVSYGKTDGMLNIECNGGLSPAGIRARDGKLWFPTQDGIAVIDPTTVFINPQPPPVAIESFLIDNASVPIDGPVQIKAGKRNLEIEYTALSFIKSDQIQFKYKMDGLDVDWINAGTRRTAYYSHLPPGDYVFQVIARNSDGVWNNEGKSLAVTVLAPFYETWWFEMLILLAIGALILIAWRYRVMQLQEANAVQQAFSRQLIASQENERKRIAAELHDSIGQRLVVINNLALFFLRSRKKDDAGGAEAQSIEELSEEAALAMKETREISYNLRPFQLDRLGLTKALEGMIRTVGTASGIRFSTELDNIDDLFPEDLRINFYRIVQESLGNIMKHAQATEVAVRVKRSERSTTLTIEDNGHGFPHESRSSHSGTSGFGMTGMAERARLLGGEFKVRSMPGRGTIVTVEIPLNGDRRG
jgi:signal transduction histidine kinase/ligand-binding sensor domain-containing protein